MVFLGCPGVSYGVLWCPMVSCGIQIHPNDPLSFDRYRGPDPTFIISREINLQVLGNNTQTDDVFHM